MTFRIEIIQVRKFFTSRSLTKLQDFGTHAKPTTRRLTLLHGPTKTDDPNSVNLREKIESLSLSLYTFFFLMLTPLSPPGFLPFFPLVCSILLLFLFLFHFLLSHYLFSFFLLDDSHHKDQVGETSPHLPCCHLSTPCLFFYFPLFFFILFIASCNTWLNVSHVFQVYHMTLVMCHSIGVPYGIT